MSTLTTEVCSLSLPESAAAHDLTVHVRPLIPAPILTPPHTYGGVTQIYIQFIFCPLLSFPFRPTLRRSRYFYFFRFDNSLSIFGTPVVTSFIVTLHLSHHHITTHHDLPHVRRRLRRRIRKPTSIRTSHPAQVRNANEQQRYPAVSRPTLAHFSVWTS